MNKNKTIVAAFDFDGTITTRDSLLPFLIHSTGYLKALSKLTTLSPEYLRYICNLSSRQKTKEITLTSFFGGVELQQLQKLGEAYAASNMLNHLITPQAKKRIAWHQAQNHLCVLISASIDVYLEPWRKSAGFDHLICSQLEVTPEKKVTGKLQGLNCWGPEKARRLKELLGQKENYTLYAYGDSRGDKELLEMADYPFYRQMP